jgi:peptide/nickel transport system ATP-binding protein
VPDLLTVSDLHIDFATPAGEIAAVRGVSFRVGPCSTVALVGESGSGKSVVGQSILRILPKNAAITRGAILFADPRRSGETVDLAKLSAESKEMRAIRGGRISIVFQEPMTSLSPLHPVGDQVSEALSLHREAGAREALELTENMLRLVGFPDAKRAMRLYPFELSGGLRQRAMIAMALVCRPALLVADEPTTALDVTIQAQILKLLIELQRELQMAILLITHDLGVVANIAEEIVVVYRGEVMESGCREDIFKRPQHPYLRALLRAVPRFEMKPGERLVPLRDIPHAEVPHLLAEKRAWPEDAVGPLIECRGLSKGYSPRRSGFLGLGRKTRELVAVDEVSLRIERGECLGLVGESGCGKTTLSKILLRAVRPDKGSILFNDHGKTIPVLDLEGEDLKRFRRHVQYIFQDPFGSLNPRMSVFDIIAEPLVIHRIGGERLRREIVHELVALVGLDRRHLRRYPHSFSGGQRQRIGIARALALKPDLVICDEPVSSLDVSIQAQILNLLVDLKKQLALTYLFISHNLAVVDYVADRIAVMCAGRIVEIAPRERLFRHPGHPYTRALIAAVPAPDLAHPLDFARLMAERASDPAAWPVPFRREKEKPLSLVEIAPGHMVEATAPPPAIAAHASGLAPA